MLSLTFDCDVLARRLLCLSVDLVLLFYSCWFLFFSSHLCLLFSYLEKTNINLKSIGIHQFLTPVPNASLSLPAVIHSKTAGAPMLNYVQGPPKFSVTPLLGLRPRSRWESLGYSVPHSWKIWLIMYICLLFITGYRYVCFFIWPSCSCDKSCVCSVHFLCVSVCEYRLVLRTWKAFDKLWIDWGKY